jgi:mycothiol synthase
VREGTEITAYGHLQPHGDDLALEIVTSATLPPTTASDVTERLLETAKADARRRGPKRILYFLHNPTPDDERLAIAHAFTPSRELLVLRRPSASSDLAPSDGPPIVPFRPGVDEQAWVTLNARAFADHPEQGAWEIDDLVQRESTAWFDAAGFFCCWIDGRLAGSCWTKIHDGPERLGELYVVCVDPDVQGLGLGRRLVRHAIAYLSEAGVAAAILYTESENDPAMGLYTSVGFTPSSRTLVMSTTIDE